ncbi:MAG: glycoside hydrolase family 88 protein [Polyangiales bacterium]
MRVHDLKCWISAGACLWGSCAADVAPTQVQEAPRRLEGEQTAKVGERIADFLIAEHPDLNAWTVKHWEYTNGILLAGIAMLHERIAQRPDRTPDDEARLARYRDYVRTFVDDYVGADGAIGYGASKQPYASVPFNQDLIQPSNLLFFLLRETGEAKYRLALDGTRALFARFPTTTEGGFWHKQNYAYQMWLDGLYMSQPFLVRYGAELATEPDDRAKCFDTATFQARLIAEKTMDFVPASPPAKLPVHAWLDRPGLDAALARGDRNVTSPPWPWDDAKTGKSPEIWGRSVGWYALALVDMLAYLPREHARREELVSVLRVLASEIARHQDPATGLWYQVLDKPPQADGRYADNFVETSASAMFVYALERGVALGLLEARYREVAARGWEGVKKKVVFDGESVVIKDAVAGMGVQDSYAHYIAPLIPGNPPTPALGRQDNTPQGRAAVMFAASVMEY